ncbi:MAG: hypothetical protein JWM60_1687 [Solirubrobacterales bacterium]|nr:hypothetical protein [Solirubrobacterales bacterium]
MQGPGGTATPAIGAEGADADEGVKDTSADAIDESVADTWAKAVALAILIGGLAYCLLGAGLAKICHAQPFQVDEANFAFFAAFIVVAGAIERFLEPLAALMPPWSKKLTSATKADRALLSSSIALIIGIIVSSAFGLYFLEAIGIKIGTVTGSAKAPTVMLVKDGDKLLRGLDVFVTALIITGGTKPLHDLISSVEKKKEEIKAKAKVAAGA